MSNSTISPTSSQVQHVREVYPSKQAAQQRIQERYEAGFRAIASPINGSTEWELHWENTNPATTDDGPRYGLGDESAFPPADGWKEEYMLLESNHATEKAEIIGTFFSTDDAIRCYSQSAWEAECCAGLKLQIICRHRVCANGFFVQLIGEPHLALVWIMASGQVLKYVCRLVDGGGYYAQLIH